MSLRELYEVPRPHVIDCPGAVRMEQHLEVTSFGGRGIVVLFFDVTGKVIRQDYAALVKGMEVKPDIRLYR